MLNKANWTPNSWIASNDRVSFRKSRINVAVNFHKYVEWNKETDLIILEMSSEIIPNSIISFISVSFTQIAAKLRPEQQP